MNYYRGRVEDIAFEEDRIAERYSEQTGKVAERNIVEMLQCGYKDMGFKDVEKSVIRSYVGNKEMDKDQGTDMTFMDVRIDITLNFSNKKLTTSAFTPRKYKSDIKIGNSNSHVYYAVRHGNNYKGYSEFPKPVVVIGLNLTPNEYFNDQDAIKSDIRKHAEELMETAQAVIDDFMETDPKTREEMDICHILSANKNYKEPKKINPEYKKMIEYQKKMDDERNTSSDTQIIQKEINV